jgi:hypothetical protein
MAHWATKKGMIMVNITQDIKNAIYQDILWSISLFFDFVEVSKNNKVEVSYWENEENWATLIIGQNPIGYLWKKYPLLFLRKDKADIFSTAIGKSYSYLSLILVDDLNEEIFELDYDSLKEYVEYGVNYSKFSATDFWFYTNSI